MPRRTPKLNWKNTIDANLPCSDSGLRRGPENSKAAAQFGPCILFTEGGPAPSEKTMGVQPNVWRSSVDWAP
jgi:hypothetical protein